MTGTQQHGSCYGSPLKIRWHVLHDRERGCRCRNYCNGSGCPLAWAVREEIGFGTMAKSNASSTRRAAQRRALDALKAKFVVCVDSADNVDLESRKVYRVKADRKSALQGFVRVVDDSGEDYLYPPGHAGPGEPDQQYLDRRRPFSIVSSPTSAFGY